MQRNTIIKTFLPHIIALVVFLLLAVIYFPQIFEGKILMQHDNQTFLGTSKELRDFREATGKEALWTNSQFSGMPGYLINTRYKANLLYGLNRALQITPRPISFLFLLLFGFYILLLSLKVNPWLSIAGAVAFYFASFNFILISVGHNSQIIAIAYMAPTLAGFILTFRNNKWLGGAVTGIFLTLEIMAGHPQITYYTALIILFYGLSELYFAIRNKTMPDFLKSAGILGIVIFLAVASNFGRLYTTYEYGKYSMRTKSELTGDKNDETKGLPKSYITGWSYGVDETLTMLIPGFKGGSNNEPVSEKSATYKLLAQNNPVQAREICKSGIPLYWGNQPGTSGPVYIGAIIVFLFVLGLFIVENRFRWWILAVTILGIMLSWGKNFMFLTDFFINHVPGYNKFRTVSMGLVIAGLTMPLLAIMALKESLIGNIPDKKFYTSLKWSFGITAGISILFALLPDIAGSFVSGADGHYQNAIAEAFREDRRTLLRTDAFRSFVFISLAAGTILLTRKKKLKLNIVIIIFGVLFLLDLWPVDRRYLNDSHFVSKKRTQQVFTPTKADMKILEDKSPDYRVLNLTVSTFNDASTSYFHHSIGGYHGAKMRRYQDLINTELSGNITALIGFLQQPEGKDPDSVFKSLNIINMLNTKYFIINPNTAPLLNPEASGNAWFINELVPVVNADQELDQLKNIDIRKQATVDSKFESIYQNNSFPSDSGAKITMTSYQPNELKYVSHSTNEGVAVFSEIYYDKGWNAYIDDKMVPYFRTDYLLRGLIVPPGDHEIVFKFHPESYYIGEKVSFAGSLTLILLLFGTIFTAIRRKKKIPD